MEALNHSDTWYAVSPVNSLDHDKNFLPRTMCQRLAIYHGISQQLFQVTHVYRTDITDRHVYHNITVMLSVIKKIKQGLHA